MTKDAKQERFEQLILPHLGAAYNLARWLTRDIESAQDIVQESFLRALRFFDAFRGGDAKSWLLTIVRNTTYSWLKQHKRHEGITSFDEELHGYELEADANPELLLERSSNIELLKTALNALPTEYREVLVLRELEELSYKEIGAILNVPIGTVMSRLARARKRLEIMVTQGVAREAS